MRKVAFLICSIISLSSGACYYVDCAPFVQEGYVAFMSKYKTEDESIKKSFASATSTIKELQSASKENAELSTTYLAIVQSNYSTLREVQTEQNKAIAQSDLTAKLELLKAEAQLKQKELLTVLSASKMGDK